MPESANVKVAVRCRPLSRKEKDLGCKPIISVGKPGSGVITLDVPENKREHSVAPAPYTFDFTYGEGSSQETVYRDVGAPLVERALAGNNCTLFAYGQTGTGKTHSMMGADTGAAAFADDSEVAGVIPRLTTDLFERLDGLITGDNSATIQVTVTYLEIYNENIHDLLNPKKGQKSLKMRQHPTDGVYVEGLCELVVKTREDIGRLVAQGNGVRRVAATQMNETSSRSHSVLALRVEQKHTVTEGSVERQTTLSSKVNLVDLAGSERANKTGAEGDTLKEGIEINKSLMALGMVIKSLSEGKFPTYRASTLTFLLKDSLGGNAATSMLAAISPADYNYDETHSTLQYAQRAKTITNKVVKNEDVNQRVVRELKEEIERLRAQLTGGGGGGSGGGGEGKVVEWGEGKGSEDEGAAVERALLQEKLAALERAQNQSWDERIAERERLTLELEKERQTNLGRTLSDRIEEVKRRKLVIIEQLRHLQAEKESLSKTVRHSKKDKKDLGKRLDAAVGVYEGMQAKRAKGEGGDALVKAMAAQMKEVEGINAAIAELKRATKAAPSRLAELDEEIDKLKAEILATSDMLNDNDNLRKKIQEEERAKWEVEKVQLLAEERAAMERQAAEMAAERVSLAQKGAEDTHAEIEALRSQLAAERAKAADSTSQLRFADEDIMQLKAENARLHDAVDISRLDATNLEGEKVELGYRISELEARVTDLDTAVKSAESAAATAKAAAEAAKRQLLLTNTGEDDDSSLEDADLHHFESTLDVAEGGVLEGIRTAEATQVSPAPELVPVSEAERLKIAQEPGYKIFAQMMQVLEKERAVMNAKLAKTRALLAEATKDLIVHAQRNKALEDALGDVAAVEKGDVVSTPRRTKLRALVGGAWRHNRTNSQGGSGGSGDSATSSGASAPEKRVDDPRLSPPRQAETKGVPRTKLPTPGAKGGGFADETKGVFAEAKTPAR